MPYRLNTYIAVIVIAVLFFAMAGRCNAQTTFENELKRKMDSLLAPVNINIRDTRAELLPNDVLQNLISPSGWGGFGTYAFGGIGGITPQSYTHNTDLIAFAGFCTGDPQKAVNVAIGFNVANVSSVKDFSGNLSVSRQLFTGSSISVGALQLFANKLVTDSPGSTFYIAFSHAIQWLPSETDGSSKLTYTIGVGNGRFYKKSVDDMRAGRGAHGTAVFGSVSYELFKNVNFITEWSGINLGCSLGIKPFNNTLAVGVGVTDLTRYSSDKAAIAFALSYPLSIKR